MRIMKSPVIELLIDNIDNAYSRKAWHGPNLRGSLRRLSLDEVCWRPGHGRHNIWEIVLHAAYWKYAVRRRILGEKRGSFPEKGSNWFLRPVQKNKSCWQADIYLLDEIHRTMRDAVMSLDPGDLSRKPHGSTMTIGSIAIGIAAHDLYHTGQIQLIKRLFPKR